MNVTTTSTYRSLQNTEKIDLDSANNLNNISNSDHKMETSSTMTMSEHKSSSSGINSIFSGPITVHVNLLGQDGNHNGDQISIENLKESLQSQYGGANGDSDEEGDIQSGDEEGVIDAEEGVDAEGVVDVQAEAGEAGEDVAEAVAEDAPDADLEDEFEEESFPIIEAEDLEVNFDTQGPKIQKEKIKEGVLRIATKRLEIVDFESELRSLIHTTYGRTVTNTGRQNIIENFINLQKDAIDLSKVDPNLPIDPMVCEYFDLNFSQKWLMPIYTDGKQVYISNSENRFGEEIFYTGGQTTVLRKIDDIMELRKNQNRETAQALSDIQNNYRTNREKGLGIQGTIQTDQRFDTQYKSGRDVLRYDPEFEKLAKRGADCVAEEPGVATLEYRRTNFGLNRRFNKHQEGEEYEMADIKKKSLNKPIIGQITDSAVTAEDVNLVGFIRHPYKSQPSPYQLYLRDNKTMSEPIRSWEKLDATTKAKYRKESKNLHRQSKTVTQVVYLECISRLDREQLALYETETVIYLFPKDTEKYTSLKEVRLSLSNSELIEKRDREKFRRLLQREKIINITTLRELGEFVNRFNITLSENAKLEDLFKEIKKLQKARSYIQFLEKIIPNIDNIITLRQVQLEEGFVNIRNLNTLLSKFGNNLYNLSRTELQSLTNILKENIKDRPLNNSKTVRDSRRKQFNALKKLNKPSILKNTKLKTAKFENPKFENATGGEVISDKILKNSELLKLYGKYPDMGKINDTDEARLSWILAQVDNGMLYFDIAHYFRLLDLLNMLEISDEPFEGQFKIVEANLLEILKLGGTRLDNDEWLKSERVTSYLGELDEAKALLSAEADQIELEKNAFIASNKALFEHCKQADTLRHKFGIITLQVAEDGVRIVEVSKPLSHPRIYIKRDSTLYPTEFMNGDLIMSFNGVKIGDEVSIGDKVSIEYVKDVLLKSKPGDKIDMRIRRINNIEYNVVVTVDDAKIKFIQALDEDDQYDLDKVCIWNGVEFVPRLYYLAEKQVEALRTLVTQLDKRAEIIYNLPTSLRHAYGKIERSATAFTILKKDAIRTQSLFNLDRYIKGANGEISLEAEAYNPCTAALRQLDGIMDKEVRNMRILEVLAQMADLIEEPDRVYFQCRNTKLYVCCVHKRDEIKLSRDDFLKRPYINAETNICSYCGEQVEVLFDSFEGFDEDGQPIRKEGDVFEEARVDKDIGTLCELNLEIVRKEVDLDWILEQTVEVDDAFILQENLQGHESGQPIVSATEIEQWVCYILRNLMDNGVIYIKKVITQIIREFMKVLEDNQKNLVDINLNIDDPRVVARYYNIINGDSGNQVLKVQIRDSQLQYEEIKDKLRDLDVKLAEQVNPQVREAIKKEISNLSTEHKKILAQGPKRAEAIKTEMIANLRLETFLDRYSYMLSQVAVEVSKAYPELMEIIPDRLKRLTNLHLPDWIHEYKYTKGTEEIVYLQTRDKKTVDKFWKQILYFRDNNVSVKTEEYLNHKWTEASKILSNANREIMEMIHKRWKAQHNVERIPYHEEFFLTSTALEAKADNLNKIDLQLKYLGQQTHIILVSLSQKLNEVLRTFQFKDDNDTGKVSPLEISKDPGCQVDTHEYYLDNLWTYFLHPEGSKERQHALEFLANIKESSVFSITKQPNLIILANQLLDLRQQETSLLKQRKELIKLRGASYAVHIEPNPFTVHKTQLNLIPNNKLGEAKEIETSKFSFESHSREDFIQTIEDLKKLASMNIDKQRTNLATYLAVYKWRQTKQENRNMKLFTDILRNYQLKLAQLGVISGERRKEADLELKSFMTEPHKLELEKYLNSDNDAFKRDTKELNLLRKYLISYFRYYTARFAFTPTAKALDDTVLERYLAPTELVDPNAVYNQELFASVVKLNNWLSNTDIQLIVNFLQDPCYKSYSLDLNIEDVKNILQYITYLDLNNSLNSLAGSGYNLMNTALSVYESQTTVIQFYNLSEVESFVATNLTYNNNFPMYYVDFIDRILRLINYNEELNYLPKSTMVDYYERRRARHQSEMNSRAKTSASDELKRVYLQMRVPWGVIDDDKVDLTIKEEYKAPDQVPKDAKLDNGQINDDVVMDGELYSPEILNNTIEGGEVE